MLQKIGELHSFQHIDVEIKINNYAIYTYIEGDLSGKHHASST